MAGRAARTGTDPHAGEDLGNEFDLGEMDVAAAAARGAEMELRHPSTGKYLGIFFLLCGADSDTYRDALRRVSDLAQKDGRKNVDQSVYERRACEMAASLTMGWSYSKTVTDEKGERQTTRVQNNIPMGGVLYPYSDENAINLYFTRRWVREQIEAFVQVRENFFPD